MFLCIFRNAELASMKAAMSTLQMLDDDGLAEFDLLEGPEEPDEEEEEEDGEVAGDEDELNNGAGEGEQQEDYASDD